MKFKSSVPSLSDPRFLFLLFFCVFLFHIFNSPAFARGYDQLFYIMGACIGIDLVFKFLHKEQMVPLSAAVSSLGIFTIIDTKFWWAYCMCAFLAVGSKYFIKIKDKHVFNPNNFSIVLAGLFLTSVLEPSGFMRWGGDLTWSFIVSLLGLVLVFRAKRSIISVTFILSFILLSFYRSQISGEDFFSTVSILLSPGLLIFTYFMITDPKTSPNSPMLQVVFAVSVALLDQILRGFEIRMSVFIALFIVTILYAVLDLFVRDKEKFNVWKYKKLDFL